tara:strand:- start:605 stop:1447 length:843 start_codon:yes stop_codon:yes gene_type:complete
MSFDEYSSSEEDSGESLSGSDYESQFGDLEQPKLFDFEAGSSVKKTVSVEADSSRTNYTEISSDEESDEKSVPAPARKKKRGKKTTATASRPKKHVKQVSQAELMKIMKQQQRGTPTTLSTVRGSASSEDIQDLQDIMDAPSVASMTAAAVKFGGGRRKSGITGKPSSGGSSSGSKSTGKLKKSKSSVSARRDSVAATGLTVSVLRRRLAKNPESAETKAQLRLAQLQEVSPEVLNSLLAKRAMLESRVSRLSKELKAAKRELKQVTKNVNAQIAAVNSL